MGNAMIELENTPHIEATESGLVFKEGYTEEEHAAAGKSLAKMGEQLQKAGSGWQWAVGDWYNAIPKGHRYKNTRKELCEEVGLPPRTAESCGYVAGVFSDFTARAVEVGFTGFRAVASLPEPQRTALLEQAAAEKWTVVQITAERKRLQQPKAIPGEQSEQQENEEMKGKKHWRMIAVEEGIANINNNRSFPITMGKIDAIDPTVRASGDEAAIRAICKQIYLTENPGAIPKAEAEAEALKADLKPTAQKKLESAVQARVSIELARLRTQYQIELAAGIKAATAAKEAYFAEKEAEIKANLREAYEKKVQADLIFEKAKEYLAGIGSHMTMDEYRLIRGCLHSDRLPEGLKSRFDKASVIFQRLEKTVKTA